MPSRLLSAFPEGTPVHRLSLEDAVERVRLSSAARLGHEARETA
jgi:ATP-dependent DNA helicase DinG